MGKKSLVKLIAQTNKKINQLKQSMNTNTDLDSLEVYKEEITELSLILKKAKEDLKKWEKRHS